MTTEAKITLFPVRGHFPIYPGLGVYGHGVCLHSLHLILGHILVSLALHGTQAPITPRGQAAGSERGLGIAQEMRLEGDMTPEAKINLN